MKRAGRELAAMVTKEVDEQLKRSHVIDMEPYEELIEDFDSLEKEMKALERDIQRITVITLLAILFFAVVLLISIIRMFS